MSDFLPVIVAPNSDGSIIVDVPLQRMSADEAHKLAALIDRTAETAEGKPDGDGSKGKLREIFKR